VGWIQTQRGHLKKVQLTELWVSKLRDIGLFSTEEAQNYKRRPESKYEVRMRANCPKLHAWVFQQVGNYRAGKLPDERIRKLEEVGVSWNIEEEKWKTRLEQLIQFKREHGHCNDTKNYATQPKLWLWCENRRRSFKMGKLKAERKAKLDEIGFDWEFSDTETISNNDTRQIKLESRWNERYNELVEFRRKYGLCAIPQKTHSKLQGWVSN
jgi:hypothetical protein